MIGPTDLLQPSPAPHFKTIEATSEHKTKTEKKETLYIIVWRPLLYVKRYIVNVHKTLKADLYISLG